MIKVLIVDDSAVIREILKNMLSTAKNIAVVGEAEDPFQARELIKQLNPDVITLDIEMPKMDGITFLRNLMRLRPMPVVMLSTLTERGADVTLEAIEIGAIDFIAKPTVDNLLANNSSFKDELLEKLLLAVEVDKRSHVLKQDKLPKSELTFLGSQQTNHVIAIGASTGGTEAIKAVLARLPENSPPIIVVQHIPENFSERFAERLNQQCTIEVVHARHGQKIKRGHAYIAPGNTHLMVEEKHGSLFCVLKNTAKVNRHRPSVDVLFRSLKPIASSCQAVLLTGMGSDGAVGMSELKDLGARTVIQDKESSLIWGMPGKAFQLNAHTSIHNLNEVSESLLSYAALSPARMKEVLNEIQ